ncbi:hypothetical protein WICMUC_004980 [Wickerhamomyces mucosus]|uniref:Actin-related protein 8 n=1 Tax=Wickerhamomyces mucosus TaxID=1378264 RepID=A0A9P8T7U3_9ASCO|nr:hypothetical protein WICMUC_004980 [Wickerhamomyces mucosus]
MSDTPIPSSPTSDLTPSRAGSPSIKNNSNNGGGRSKKQSSQIGKKVSAEILERRRAGRLKAAETMARNIKKSGIERRENPVKFSVFDNVNLINQKNYFTDYLKKDEQSFILRERRLLRGSQKSTVTTTTTTATLARDKKESSLSIKEQTSQLNDEDDDNDDNDNDDDNDENGEQNDRHGSRTIVIHPGSKYIRIGLASDIYPKTYPFVIGIPKSNDKKSSSSNNGIDVELEDQKNLKIKRENKESLYKDFKERMKYYKRRIIPNSNEIVQNYNKKSQPESIPEHNDLHKFEFIKPSNKDKYFIGEDAFKLDSNRFRLRYPLQTNGKFNYKDYKSIHELIGEIQLYLREILSKNFQIDQFSNYKIVLIIPDLYDKIYIEKFIELLLQMEFNSVAIIQESLAATYGAGISNACVVDIGAQTTKISCIDDGMIISNSRAVLNYGGDDITTNFYNLLKNSNFPINFNPNIPYEWQMMEQLKEKFITFQDANITVQLYNFIKRFPNKLSEKYEFKVFDEVILSPMGLFFPKIFEKTSINYENLKSSKDDQRSRDVFSGELDDPLSKTQKDCFQNSNIYANQLDFEVLKDLIDTNNLEDGIDSNSVALTPLDKAIIQSIANASRYDFTKMKNFFENILIVGGGSKIESLDFILIDRINIWRPKLLTLLNLPDFLKNIETIINKHQTDNEYSKNNENIELIDELNKNLFNILERELNQFLSQYQHDSTTVQVLPSPREIDPSILTWKGGSVFGRLKIMEELWITKNDWELIGSRTLQYKSLFNY